MATSSPIKRAFAVKPPTVANKPVTKVATRNKPVATVLRNPKRVLIPTDKRGVIELATRVYDEISTKDEDILADFSEFEEQVNSVPIPQFITAMVNGLSDQVSAASFVVACFYLHKLHVLNPDLVIARFNFHRLFILSLSLATKFVEDTPFTINQWVHVVSGFLDKKKFASAEAEFLTALNFEMFADTERLSTFVAGLYSDK